MSEPLLVFTIHLLEMLHIREEDLCCKSPSVPPQPTNPNMFRSLCDPEAEKKTKEEETYSDPDSLLNATAGLL